MSRRAITKEDQEAASLYAAMKGHPTYQQSNDFDLLKAIMFHHAGHPEKDIQMGFIGERPSFFGNSINKKSTRATIFTLERKFLKKDAELGMSIYPNVRLLDEKTDKVKDQYFFLCQVEHT